MENRTMSIKELKPLRVRVASCVNRFTIILTKMRSEGKTNYKGLTDQQVLDLFLKCKDKPINELGEAEQRIVVSILTRYGCTSHADKCFACFSEIYHQKNVLPTLSEINAWVADHVDDDSDTSSKRKSSEEANEEVQEEKKQEEPTKKPKQPIDQFNARIAQVYALHSADKLKITSLAFIRHEIVDRARLAVLRGAPLTESFLDGVCKMVTLLLRREQMVNLRYETQFEASLLAEISQMVNEFVQLFNI